MEEIHHGGILWFMEKVLCRADWAGHQWDLQCEECGLSKIEFCAAPPSDYFQLWRFVFWQLDICDGTTTSGLKTLESFYKISAATLGPPLSSDAILMSTFFMCSVSQNIDLHALTGWIPERIAMHSDNHSFSKSDTFRMLFQRLH